MALERSGACFFCTVSNLGAPLAKTVIKAHILTGDDCMSKVGTKHAAMASDPVQYLTNFGEVNTLSDQDTALAENTWYVSGQGSAQIQLLKLLMTSGWKITAVPARAGIDALPLTSSVIRGHIQRDAFLVLRACHLFETAKEPMARLGPMEHGWEEHFGTLLPSKGLKPLPQYVSVSASVRLDDVAAGVPCITFCHRKVDNPSCKSPSH